MGSCRPAWDGSCPAEEKAGKCCVPRSILLESHSILKVLRSPAIKTSILFRFFLIYLTTEPLSCLRILRKSP